MGSSTQDGSYRLVSTATGYTSSALPVNAIGRDGIPQATIWGYNRTLPIATVANGTAVTGTGSNEMKATAGHTSFEEDGVDSDGWVLPANFSSEAKTGARSARYITSQSTYGLGKTLVLTPGANQKGKLVFSCWAKVPSSVSSPTSFLLVASSSLGGYNQSPSNFQVVPGQDWKYCEFLIDLEDPKWGNAGTKRDLPMFFYLWIPSGAGELLIDEVRIHRMDAQMQTATYQPLVGKTSSTGADGRTQYYTYGSDNSPLLVLNHNRDVLRRTQSKVVNGVKLTADFVAPGYGTTQVTMGFASELNGCADGTDFIWNFGDNTPTVTGPVSSHTYASSGTYQVSLILTHPQRGVDRVTKNIQICDPLSLYIDTQGNISVDFCNYPGATDFTLTAVVDNPCGQPISYQWQSQVGGPPGGPQLPWGNIQGQQGASFSSQVFCGQTIRYRCIITTADGNTNENDPNLPEVTTVGNNYSSPGTPVCGC